MSIIIRLQNLPWSANALDIRQYFAGLQIPEGGVHIVGGELGDAFIAFSTDEDARQAFLRNDGKIKSVQIKLMLSSRTEMQRVIEQARTQSMAAFMLPANTQVPPPLPAAVPAAIPPVVPAAVPEIIKRDSKERDSEKKRDRKRSRTRSKSRDRRDRSRDRKDRRHRDRSRTRSRDRRDRRRRDRSRSRNRSRDRDSRRKDRGKTPKREEKDTSPFQREPRKPVPEVWANRPAVNVNPTPALNILPPLPSNEGPGILGAFPLSLDATKRTIVENLGVNLPPQNVNGFPGNSQITNQAFGIGNRQSLASRQRDSWPPANPTPPGGVSLATAAQRRSIADSFNRPSDNSFKSASNNGNRIVREDPRRDLSSRERERTKAPGPPYAESRSDNNGRRSRFDDVDSTPVNACISMEPFYGSYGDVRRFFSGLSINYKGIKVINDEYGRKTGVCYVQFRDTHNKNDALTLNGEILNNVAMKIQHLSDKTFTDAIDRYNPRMDDDMTEDQFGRLRSMAKFKNPVPPEEQIKDFICLKVEGLPALVKEQDILHIFSQHPLISLHLNFKPKGGNTAYVKFGSKEVAKLALAERSHHVIDGRPVTVKPCKDEEFEQINEEQNSALDETMPKDVGTDCLSISNLPSKTNDRDISDFFSDIGVIPVKIHLMSNNMGFTGQAYCEFESTEEATKASTKDKTVLGQNTVSVQPITRADMEGVLNNSLPHPGTAPGLPLAPGTPLPPIKPEHVPKVEPFIKPDIFAKKQPMPKPEAMPEVQIVTEIIDDDMPINPPAPQVAAQSPMASPGNTQVQPLQPPPMPHMLERLDRPERSETPMMRGPPMDFDGPHGAIDHRDHFNGTRGPGPRASRFGPPGPRGNSRFNDEGSRFHPEDGGHRFPPQNSRFNPRDHDGPGFNPRNQDGPGFNPRSHDGPGFNPRNQDGPGFNPRNQDGPGFNPRNQDGPGFNPRNQDGPGFNPRNQDGPRYNPRNHDGPGFNPRNNHDGPGFNPRNHDGPGYNEPNMDDGSLDDIPGCTVFMENVPYKAGTNEILDFFEGYNCTNNVSRRYNQNNTPSSEAKVTFFNPDDAFRAVRDLHGMKMWGRPIFLRQA